MTGKPATEYSFTKSNQAITFSAKSSIKNGEKIQVDPELLLFQRLIIASQSLDDRSPIFKYQLCSYSPSLFDSSLMLLKSLKPVFADAIWAKLPSDATEPKGKYNMSWMVAHSFIGSFGLELGFPKYRVPSGRRLPNTSLTGRCWSPNSSDSCGKRKKGEHCSRGGRHWSPYRCCYTELSALELFSAWAMGKFNKTTCLEHINSEGEAGSRREQQLFLRPCNPWMWYYFSPSRDWKGDLSEEILWSHHFRNQAKVFNNTSA